MIIVVGGIKGGSGKSTVATNLAVLCATEGQDILLIDSDDQETASDFTILRNESQPDKPAYTCIKLTGAAVRTETLRLSTKYETIIIDTGGRDTTSQRAALSVANVLLVPFVPRSFDVWTLEKVGALVAEIRTINPDLLAYTFINRADPKGQDNDDAADVLKETDALTFIDAKLGMRKAFSNAAATGQGVAELKPSDSKAIAEMAMLFQCVFNVTPTLNKY
jgi:chromosome partitioning protein